MNKIGSRVECETCGNQLIVTKAGDGEVMCCERPMTPASGAPGDLSASS